MRYKKNLMQQIIYPLYTENPVMTSYSYKILHR